MKKKTEEAYKFVPVNKTKRNDLFAKVSLEDYDEISKYNNYFIIFIIRIISLFLL